MLEVVLLIEFITFIISLSFGVLVFARDTSSALRRAFAFTAFSNAFWTLALFLILTGIARHAWVGRASFIFGSLYVVGFLWFSLVYPYVTKRTWALWLPAVFCGALTLIPLIPSFMGRIWLEHGTIRSVWNQALLVLYFLIFISVFVVASSVLLYRRRHAEGLERLRLTQLLIGFLLMCSLQVLTNLVLPVLWSDFRWNNLGPAFTLLLLPFMANAVLRYRLLDIRWILSTSALFTGMVVFVVGVMSGVYFALASFLNQQYAFIVGALFVAITIRPMMRSLERGINWLAHHGSYDPKLALQEVLEIVHRELVLQRLLASIAERLRSNFGLEELALVAFAPGKTTMVGAHLFGFDASIHESQAKISKLLTEHGNGIVETEELAWQYRYQSTHREHRQAEVWIRLLQSKRITAVIPIVMQHELVGYMLFGRRAFEGSLREADVAFLVTLAAGIAPALQNAAKFAEIKELYAKLKEADVVKTQFIDTVSHQFRTPLAAIRWNAEAMLEMDVASDGEVRKTLEDVHDRAVYLAHTLSEFFDTLALERGDMSFQIAPFQTSDLAAAVTHCQEEVLLRKHIAFTAELGAFSAVGDVGAVKHVLENVLGNAIKYTPEGGSIQCAAREDSGQVVLSVADSGIGIAKQDLERRLFSKFFRAKNAIAAVPDGVGLGLYLAKEIMRRQKGDVLVRSTLGEGTTVEIFLPTSKAK